MGYQPVRPPWPKGQRPTEEQRAAYRAYLVGSLASTRLGRMALRRAEAHGSIYPPPGCPSPLLPEPPEQKEDA